MPNVLRLGRTKVCALKRGDIEIPRDYVSVVSKKMDSGLDKTRQVVRHKSGLGAGAKAWCMALG